MQKEIKELLLSPTPNGLMTDEQFENWSKVQLVAEFCRIPVEEVLAMGQLNFEEWLGRAMAYYHTRARIQIEQQRAEQLKREAGIVAANGMRLIQ